MSIFHNGLLFRIISRYLSTSNLVRNYYRVLKLPRNCTHKEIKESFIKLSKEHHPDKNSHKDSHKKFSEINEAYKVLSKPDTRRLYDLGFSRTTPSPNRGHYGKNPWNEPSFYRNTDRSKSRFETNYYGIKGLKKVSNFTVAIFCVSIAAFVVGLQLLAIRYSVTFKRDSLIKRSNEAEETLRSLKQSANTNGNDLQIELLQMRFDDFRKPK